MRADCRRELAHARFTRAPACGFEQAIGAGNDLARLVITVELRFDFKRCYEGALSYSGVRSITVDLKNVEYVDSAALGMLLLLKQHAEARALPVTLLDCGLLVKEIFDVANFGQIFEIR